MLPRWDDPELDAGTMVRTALWLISEVGVGNAFTKEQHRRAFEGVAQADRRLRDLRRYGWVIHTSLEDKSLNSNEQRLVSVGDAVWKHGVQRTERAVSAKARGAVLANSEYQCATCGIAGGERYPDAPHLTAILSVTRRSVRRTEGEETLLVCECNRCRAGQGDSTIDLSLFLARAKALPPKAREVLREWIARGRTAELDALWVAFRRMPEVAKDDVRNALKIL